MSSTAFAASPFLLRRSGLFWPGAALLCVLLLLIPLISLIILALSADENAWPHLWATVLPGYLRTTLALMLGAGLLAGAVGTACAWAVVMCRFPGRKLLSWGLMLPLAAPTYVVAYLYTSLLDYSGPVQTLIRSTFGFSTPRDYWFPEIRSLGGAIFVMGFTLFPYVYMLARAAFAEQGPAAMDAARTLGSSPRRTFFRIALPLARPAIAAGTALVMMEVLNDFGTVDHFALRTLTAGIFNVWLKMQNSGGAAQIALLMLVIVVALLGVERRSRSRQRQYQGLARRRDHHIFRLTGIMALLVSVACALPVMIGFGVPLVILLSMVLDAGTGFLDAPLLSAGVNSFKLATLTALICLVLGGLIAYARRLAAARSAGASGQRSVIDGLAQIATLGYAIPGAVLALGILIPFGAFDAWLDYAMQALTGESAGLVVSGTMFALIFAYAIRFFALAHGAFDGALGRIRPNLDQAARSLGCSPLGVFRRVHIPLLRGTTIVAFLLVFVDVMKELPATLILRPFNTETLATLVYQHAATEQIELAAPAALAIVAAGLLPVLLLNTTLLKVQAP